jgi:hypothetical protein
MRAAAPGETTSATEWAVLETLVSETDIPTVGMLGAVSSL